MPAWSATGWLAGVHHAPSPNCDARPDNSGISLIVIHNISLPPGEFGAGLVQDFFCNTLDVNHHPRLQELLGVEVSAHFLVDREGAVTQFVSVDDRAWHAGQSCFGGRERCNDFSIGIELEGTDHCAYTDEQYRALVSLIGALRERYPSVTRDAIVGHEHIAPGRKTDPGPAFDWPRLYDALGLHQNGVSRS